MLRHDEQTAYTLLLQFGGLGCMHLRSNAWRRERRRALPFPSFAQVYRCPLRHSFIKLVLIYS
jgi:hypothetical protein